jgi:phospholipid-binding lipoprotein MlaA
MLAILVLALGVGACQSTNTAEERQYVAETRDPLEPLNRHIFGFNEGLDELVFKPVAAWYGLIHTDVRDAITRGLDNASLPWTFINEVFQGEFDRARITAARFAINTTLGVGGLFDHATAMGFPHHNEDFGLTLARRFGAQEGPYLVVPLLGPSNPRDLVGRLVDTAADPVSYIIPTPGGFIRGGLRAVDTRQRNIDNIDELRRNSTDFYATIRSVVRQRREAEINRGEISPDIPRVVTQAPTATPTRVSAGSRWTPPEFGAPDTIESPRTRTPARRARQPVAPRPSLRVNP